MTQTPAAMTSSDTPWTQAKLAALADHDRAASVACAAFSMLFLALSILSTVSFHQMAG